MGYRTAVLGDERGGEKKGKKITQRITVGYLIAVEVSVESKVHQELLMTRQLAQHPPFQLAALAQSPRAVKEL